MFGRQTPCFLLFATLLTGVVAEEASLEILPLSRPIRKEVGENLVLTCQPQVPKPELITNLEWRDKNNRRIQDNDRKSPVYVQNVPNNVGIMLVFPGLAEQHAGTYSCHANYANTEKLFASVEVNTFIDVQFVNAPENQYLTAGKDGEIKCEVKAKPPPLIDWYKGEQLIVSTNANARYIPKQDGLKIINVTEADDGIYKCSAVVLSTGAFKTRNIKVEVQVAPKILPMRPVDVVEGETASVKCTATGKPPPSYRWIKLGQRQDLSVTDRFSVKETTGELIMNRVELNDDDLYKCEAWNAADRAETEVRINVLMKPQIYELLNVTASVTNRTQLVCKAKGKPPPIVTFRKRSNPEPFRSGRQENDPRIELTQKPYPEKVPSESVGILTINDLARSDDGLYECIAENPTGRAYKNGHVTVWFKPTFERTRDLPSVWSWDGRPGNLSCLPEAIPNATIVWRWNQIEISEENFQQGRISRNNFEVIGRGPRSFLIVKPFNERRLFTQYECLARNELGEDSINIELKQGTVPGPLGQVRPHTITATTVKFSIVPPTSYDTLPIRGYKAQYKDERSPGWQGASIQSWSYGAPYNIENLLPEFTYAFRFCAWNDVGQGPWTNIPVITMPRRSAPAEPTILLSSALDANLTERQEIQGPFSNHFELRWNVPADNGEPIQHYTIRYCKIGHVNGQETELDCNENIQQSVKYTNFPLDNLSPDTLYKVELRAHNAIGDSTPATIRVRTARGVGPVPVDSPAMSSGLIVGIVVGAVLIVLIVVDMTCFVVNRTGLIAMCCEKTRRKKHDEEDPKLGSEEKEPLNQPPLEKPISVEFDGRQVYTKSGEIIGKHSAV